jgi:arylsulfatase A-like enzyme
VFTPDEIEHLRELYDGEILYSDFLIREMFKELKRAGMWEETVVIITSDHGENIGHHDMMDHVFSLYESTIHVPLIIRIPNGRSRGVQDSRLVQLTDLFPTMLALARLDCREYPSQGTDLFAFGEAVREEILCEYYYPVQVLQCYDEARREHPLLEPYKRRIRCLIQDSKKLIWGSDGRNEFYDLSQDPHEVDNLIHDAGYADDIDGMTERLQALIAQYASVRADAPPADASDLDDETRERLRSLGYTQ